VEVQGKEQMLKITEGYEPMNIYNADDLELFFRVSTKQDTEF
jgi:hypothetical protein